jgi:dTMP kinase
MAAEPARFVVFEGGEGAGKTAVSRRIAERMTAAGTPHIHIREPGGTPVGEQIRQLLHGDLSLWGEAFAFLLARAEHVDRVISPALAEGKTVLCDRFSMSTLAYQGYARGLDLETLRRADAAATGGLTPGLTIFIDIPPEAGLRRKLGEGATLRTGKEGLEFHRKVHAGYKALVAEAGPAAITIDGTQPLDAVVEEAWASLE